MPVRVIGMIGVTPPQGGATLACHRGRLVAGLCGRGRARARGVGVRSRPGRLFVVVRRRLSGGAACRRPYRAARLSDRASAGLCGADADGAQDRDLRSSHRRPPRGTHHHRQDRRRAGGRRRFHPEGGTLSPRRRISRTDETDMGERASRSISPANSIACVAHSSDVHPLQKPHPLLFFGGASDGALEMGARLCDVYAIYAEPLASTRERMAAFRAQAAAFGRVPGFNVSVRPIIARDRRRGLGQGAHDPCRDGRRQRLEPAGGRVRAGRQCRAAADEFRARKRHP